MYYTLYFLYTVFMYCSYTIFIYLYSYAVHFLYCFHVILFIWLSLLCTCICCHIFSYDIHILCFSCAFHILCFSFTILLYFSSCFCNCLYFDRIEMLCFSYHVISYTLHLRLHSDYRIGIHDRFDRESRHVCHSVVM